MFTGLIEEIGRLRAVRPFPGGRRLEIGAPALTPLLTHGESVACHGLCLTVERIDTARGCFEVAAVAESLKRSTAGQWRVGQKLHLERALAAGARLGGHLVQGHVDGVGRVMRIGPARGSTLLVLRLPRELLRYVVLKGSLAVDGVSLTVASMNGPQCGLAIIPETLARTRIGAYRPADRVNIETDLVGKYVESLTQRV
ncbi:MAG: riboflavin synthase [Candidatus Eisenbacteria bacterium]